MEKYTQDVIYGGEWKWSYYNGQIVNLEVSCPRCKTPMKSLYNFTDFENRDNWYTCETCGHHSSRISGNNQAFEQAVGRQIVGKIKRGEHLET